MKPWLSRVLISLSVAVACAKATDERLLGDDDDHGGESGGGFGGTGFGGTGFGGTATTGGRGGTTSGGTTGIGGAQGGTGATSGKGGTGGSDGGVGAEGGEGGTVPCNTVAKAPDIRIDYKASTRPVEEDPEGAFHLVNGTGEPIILHEHSFRYWFTSEFTCSETTSRMAVNVVHQQFLNPYATLGAANVTDRVVSLGTGGPGCDAYFEIGFTEQVGSLAAGQTAVVQYYASIPIYEAARPKNQANDYSYGASATDFVHWDKITVYKHGCLVSGREPGSGGEGGEGGVGGENSGGLGGA